MVYTSFEELVSGVKALPERKRMALAAAEDEHSLQAALNARREGVARPILVGNKAEILRIRLDEVKRLLKETDRSIDDIAVRCGWRTTVALQTLFKRRFGKSMRNWRANG